MVDQPKSIIPLCILAIQLDLAEATDATDGHQLGLDSVTRLLLALLGTDPGAY